MHRGTLSTLGLMACVIMVHQIVVRFIITPIAKRAH